MASQTRTCRSPAPKLASSHSSGSKLARLIGSDLLANCWYWQLELTGAACFSHAASFGRCARRRARAGAMRSSDCCSVRSASGTLWVLKNVLISAAVPASQNDDSAPTMTVLPTNSPVFFWISAQRSRSSCHARRWVSAVGEHARDDELRVLGADVGRQRQVHRPPHERGIRRTTSARRDSDSAPRDRSPPCCARGTGRRARRRPRPRRE